MINLIPNKEKKEMVRGFYYRLIVLFLLMISVSFLILFFSILPSYLLSIAKNNIVNTKLKLQKNEPVPLPDQQTLTIIKDLDDKINLIESAASNKFIISQKVINAIVLRKLPDIKITDISYEANSSKTKGKKISIQGKKISIQGNAPSREVLLLFRLALESDTLFKQVDLPISNFIKGSNIQFSLSLTPL
ncbi:hypothetical protein EXS45_01685 [Candidatus Nomurabacteria bacterium]|nr:hypothetical protein [Candidatus Nomurabacteria bacterium]